MSSTAKQKEGFDWIDGVKLAYWLVSNTLRIAWFFKITLLWIALIAFGFSHGVGDGIALLALGIAVSAWPKSRHLGPVIADAQKLYNHITGWWAGRRGNDLIRRWSLVSRNDEHFYSAFYFKGHDEDCLRLAEPIDGLTPAEFENKCVSYQKTLKASRVAIDIDGHDWFARFFKKDPLDDVVKISEPPAFDHDKMIVSLGVDQDAGTVELPFANCSGIIVGGRPGSGKTAATSMLVAPLAVDPGTRLSVLDAKGGDDWDAYRSHAATFVSEATDLSLLRDALEAAVTRMNTAIATNKDKLGVSNFWEATYEQRLAAGVQFELIIFDECANVFDTTGMSKDDKEIAAEILRLSTLLVRKGRSAGFCVIFITQRPTVDTMPSKLRDLCARRISLKQMNAESEKATLGDRSEDVISNVSAVAIPDSRPGGAVMGDDKGIRFPFRFYFWPENDMKDYLNNNH